MKSKCSKRNATFTQHLLGKTPTRVINRMHVFYSARVPPPSSKTRARHSEEAGDGGGDEGDGQGADQQRRGLAHDGQRPPHLLLRRLLLLEVGAKLDPRRVVRPR